MAQSRINQESFASMVAAMVNPEAGKGITRAVDGFTSSADLASTLASRQLAREQTEQEMKTKEEERRQKGAQLAAAIRSTGGVEVGPQKDAQTQTDVELARANPAEWTKEKIADRFYKNPHVPKTPEELEALKAKAAADRARADLMHRTPGVKTPPKDPKVEMREKATAQAVNTVKSMYNIAGADQHPGGAAGFQADVDRLAKSYADFASGSASTDTSADPEFATFKQHMKDTGVWNEAQGDAILQQLYQEYKADDDSKDTTPQE